MTVGPDTDEKWADNMPFAIGVGTWSEDLLDQELTELPERMVKFEVWSNRDGDWKDDPIPYVECSEHENELLGFDIDSPKDRDMFFALCPPEQFNMYGDPDVSDEYTFLNFEIVSCHEYADDPDSECESEEDIEDFVN